MARYPVLPKQYPVLLAQYPVLLAQYPILLERCQVLLERCQVLLAWYPVLLEPRQALRTPHERPGKPWKVFLTTHERPGKPWKVFLTPHERPGKPWKVFLTTHERKFPTHERFFFAHERFFSPMSGSSWTTSGAGNRHHQRGRGRCRSTVSAKAWSLSRSPSLAAHAPRLAFPRGLGRVRVQHSLRVHAAAGHQIRGCRARRCWWEDQAGRNRGSGRPFTRAGVAWPWNGRTGDRTPSSGRVGLKPVSRSSRRCSSNGSGGRPWTHIRDRRGQRRGSMESVLPTAPFDLLGLYAQNRENRD